MPKKLLIEDLLSMKAKGRKIATVSCYDYTTAKIMEAAGIDMLLVGDSAAQLVLGLENTLGVSMDFMVEITSAVRRGAPNTCIIGDMPFMSYQASIPEAIKNAARFITESRADIVKIEINSSQVDIVKAVSDCDIPVMAHIGLRPQSIAKTGKLKAQGTDPQAAYELICLANKVVEAGASTLLIEGTTREVSKIITDNTSVPVISCGAGPDCDGQVLVITDILGMTQGNVPKFVQNFANLSEEVLKAAKNYKEAIKNGQFPQDSNSYHISANNLKKLQDFLQN